MIKCGDRVKFLSDTGVGIVTKVTGDMAEVEMEDGFEMPVLLSELVVVDKEEELATMEYIGMGDERPGTKKGAGKAKKEQEEKRRSVREPAFTRYGKVSLTADDEDEEPLDVYQLKAAYRKSLANRQKLDEAIEAENRRRETERQRTLEEGKAAEPAASVPGETPAPEQKKAPEPVRKAPADPEVVDLHAAEILESCAGMSSGEIVEAQLARFVVALDLAVATRRHGKIVFIHGVGTGKLRYEIEKKLRRDYPKLRYQDASFKEYGYGAVIIYY